VRSLEKMKRENVDNNLKESTKDTTNKPEEKERNIGR